MVAKRAFDVFLSALLLLAGGWLILLLIVAAAIDTRSGGIFMQQRVGRYGRLFTILKLRSIGTENGSPHVSHFGKFLRRTKLDELPQLVNVLIGDMSFVGPRPDVKGYYDTLSGDDRNVLQLRPGLTSEAALKYLHEENLLAAQDDPAYYNDYVLFPDKVRMNLEYYRNRSFWGDIRIMVRTMLVFLKS